METTKNKDKDFLKTMLSVAHMGLFYGLFQDSESIFFWCDGEEKAKEAVVCGRAFHHLLKGKEQDAIMLLKNALKTMKGDVLKALFITAAMQSKKVSQRNLALPMIEDIKKRLTREDPACALVEIAEGVSGGSS